MTSQNLVRAAMRNHRKTLDADVNYYGGTPATRTRAPPSGNKLTNRS